MTFKKLVMTSFIQKKWVDVCTLEYGKGIRGYKNEDNEFSVYGSAGKVGTHSEFHLEKGVIVSRKGTLGVHYSDAPFFVIDTAFFLKPKPELNAKWAYYALKNFDIKKLTSGTGVPSLSRNEFYAEDLLLPPIDDQNKVESILSRLDEKIELNQKMNETLEEITKTLFKSWFIDFDPVRAKAEGRPTGLSKEISDLFPDSFEKSELGEMPSGWQTKNLGQILTFLGSGKRPKGGASVTDDQIPSIGAENINFIGNYDYSKEKYVPRNFYENLKEKGISIKDYDILIYKDGANIGRSTIFGKGFPHKDCTINEHAHLLRSERGIQKYLYFYLSTKQSQEYLISLNTASAQPGINQTQLKTLNILKPEKKILEKFDVLVAPIVDLIFLNCLANNNLSDIRDALLPKLISGELKISDAENLLKEADI